MNFMGISKFSALFWLILLLSTNRDMNTVAYVQQDHLSY